jgi:ATP-dependent DNA helicase RecG
LGPSEPWQVALLLPEHYDDLTQLPESAGQLDPKQPRPIRLRLGSRPQACYGRGVPRLTFEAADDQGVLYHATIFGDTKQWMESLLGVENGIFLATSRQWNERTYLTVHERVEDTWIGRIRPTYPSRRQVLSAARARDCVVALLPAAINQAAAFIEAQLRPLGHLTGLLTDCGAHGWSLEQIIHQAHLPVTLRHAHHANTVMRRLAALAALVAAHASTLKATANPMHLATLDERIAQLPWALTQDQHNAIRTLANQMKGPRPLHAIVAGDVGVGKSAVAAVLIAAVSDIPGRKRVAMLLPNAMLAEQLYREIHGFHPDLDMQLVTGETESNQPITAQILIGTSALLHRDQGDQRIDLAIIDELHRWSRAQREHLVTQGTHLLELSATPIPRTQALARYGRIAVVEMRQTAKPKSFVTRLYHGSQAGQMSHEISEAIATGAPVLVVYPKREASLPEEIQSATVAPGQIDDRHSVAQAAVRWEKVYPGRVRTLTSDDDDQRKAEVLEEVKRGTCSILLCTTVIEVGLNLPNVFHIVIVCPERYGLMALHQIRGRTARNGGEGFCYLWCPNPVNDEQRERLEMFCATSDGFVLADYDMRRRGVGDLSGDSDKQSGSDDTFLYGTKLDVSMLDDVLPVWTRWSAGESLE